jgi:hypothetical protein
MPAKIALRDDVSGSLEVSEYNQTAAAYFAGLFIETSRDDLWVYSHGESGRPSCVVKT